MNEHTSAQFIWTGIDEALHASHLWNRADTRNARLLHDAITQLIADSQRDDFSSQKFYNQVWQYEKRLKCPPVTWGVGDAFEVQADREHPVCFVLPTNTKLSTTARSVLRARKRFGAAPFDELLKHHARELGALIETSAGTAGPECRIVHVVCREPGNPVIRSLGFPGTRRIEMSTVIPFWGTTDEISLWASALAVLLSEASIGSGRSSILVRFMPEDKRLGYLLESALVLKHVIVGREEGCGIEHDSGSFGDDLWRDLARRVKPEGPLTPDVYAEWKASGIELSPAAWFTLYTILERGAPTQG